jgi:hypothetical protein
MRIDFERVQSMFQAVVELLPEARGAMLDRECAGDLELRRQVEAP